MLRAFLNGLFKDERGVTSLVMGLGLVVISGFAALAVDLGRLHLARGRLQTAADAAALAAAREMVAAGADLEQVRTVALQYARANLGAEDVPNAAVTGQDVVFLKDGVPAVADPDQVEVRVARREDRNNPLTLYFGAILGQEHGNVGAAARAGIVPVCASQCLKPFSVPAKFTWDDNCADPKSKYYNNGKFDPESPEEVASVQVQGYSAADVGARVVLTPGDVSGTIVPSQYNLVDYPPVNKGSPVSGAAALEENIAGCDGTNAAVVETGDEIQLEPGQNTGPIRAGMEALLAQDPGASWDAATQSIQGSAMDDPLSSPRVALISFYDPARPPDSGRNTIFVWQLGAVFLEGINQKGEITARFINAVARSPKPTDSSDCTLFMVRLVRDASR